MTLGLPFVLPRTEEPTAPRSRRVARRRAHPAAALIAAAFGGALLVVALGPARGAAQETAPAPRTDAYLATVQAALQLAAAGDRDGAMTRLREAVTSDAARPEAPYYVATLQRANAAFDTALTGFQQAASLAERSNKPRWRARALAGVASTLERMEGRLADAREAWQEYVRFADQNQAVAHPQMGRARVRALDTQAEQERVYVDVRRRIAEREAVNAE